MASGHYDFSKMSNLEFETEYLNVLNAYIGIHTDSMVNIIINNSQDEKDFENINTDKAFIEKLAELKAESMVRDAQLKN